MKASYEKAVFETMSVPRAVMTLAVPTIISQIVTMIYNLGDTFFVGQIGDPSMVAAVTVVSPWFNLLTALGNLFGIGASSLISRQMGAGEREKSRYVSAFSFWGGAAVTLVFSALSVALSRPLLTFLGASADNFAYAADYLFWVVGLGGVPTMLGMTLAHLLRSEGHANQAGFGMMLGGVLNLILDPVFIFGFGLDVAGAAIATALSNLIGMVYFLVVLWRLHGEHLTALSLHPRYFGFHYLWPVFSVGLASALATTLGNISNMVIVRLASGYGDIPVAAYGIVKRLDQFPLNVCMGLCQGFMPLVGYNFAAKNYNRMRKISTFSWKVGMAIAACFMACFAAFAPFILDLFIRESERDRGAGRELPAHRLPGCAANRRQFPHQLYPAGNGPGRSVGHSDLLPPGAFEYSAADSDELADRAVRHDLGAADGGGHHAARLAGDVLCHAVAHPQGGSRPPRRSPTGRGMRCKPKITTARRSSATFLCRWTAKSPAPSYPRPRPSRR